MFGHDHITVTAKFETEAHTLPARPRKLAWGVHSAKLTLVWAVRTTLRNANTCSLYTYIIVRT
jgi:hypothetical protein